MNDSRVIKTLCDTANDLTPKVQELISSTDLQDWQNILVCMVLPLLI
jgi:hypothetical protein